MCAQEEKSGEKASAAKDMKLYGQIHPIEKMDASLSTLTNCEWVLRASQFLYFLFVFNKLIFSIYFIAR